MIVIKNLACMSQVNEIHLNTQLSLLTTFGNRLFLLAFGCLMFLWFGFKQFRQFRAKFHRSYEKKKNIHHMSHHHFRLFIRILVILSASLPIHIPSREAYIDSPSILQSLSSNTSSQLSYSYANISKRQLINKDS